MARFVLVAILAGCSFQLDAPLGPRDDGGPGSDVARDGDPDADTTADAPGPWSTPTPIVSLGGADDATMTGDLLELYFNASNDIYGMTRATSSSPWSMPTLIVELSSSSGETTPEITADGLVMVISSDRAGGLGGTELWMSTRATRSAAWGAPSVMTGLNWSGADASGVMSTDRLAIVVTSDRVLGTMSDIYLSERAAVGAAWSTPTPTTALNTPSHEGSAFLGGNKLLLCFDTNRTGDHDLYCAERASTSAPFGAPQPLPAPINGTSNEEDPWLSPDGRHIVFTSSRVPTGLWEASR